MDKIEFIKLLDKYLSKTASPEEVKSLYAYYMSFQEDGIEDSADNDLDQEERLKRLHEAMVLSGLKDKRVFKNYYLKYAVAASITFLSLICIWMFYKHDRLKAPSLAIMAKKGELKVIELSDGTKVRLNAASKLFYPDKFLGNTREVELQGEAFFEVIHNVNKPFIVHTEDIDIRVLGTEFNVKAYPDDKRSEASLVKGSIEVILKKGALKSKTSNKFILKPAEKFVYYKEDLNSGVKADVPAEKADEDPYIKIVSLSNPDLHAETGWTTLRLNFHNQTLAEIAKVLERRFDVEIVFERQEAASATYSMDAENQSLNFVLEKLNRVGTFNYRKGANGKIIIY